MKFLENITNIIGLNVDEQWLRVAVFLGIIFIVWGLINLLFKIIIGGFFSTIVNMVLLVIIGLGLYVWASSQTKEKLKITIFKTAEESYAPTDEIYFHVKTNKEAFIYLYSFNKGKERKLSFPKNSHSKNLIPANDTQEIGSMRFSQTNTDFIHGQKVILVASTRPLHDAKRVMSPSSFSKMIDDGSDTVMHSISEVDEITSADIEIPINNQAKIKINLDTKVSKLQEELYIDTLSSDNGYVTLFEGTAKKLDRIEGREVRSDEVFPSQVDSVAEPLGEHIIVAIYTPQKEQLTTSDFSVETKEQKGGVEYSLEFKNQLRPYAIRAYRVIK